MIEQSRLANILLDMMPWTVTAKTVSFLVLYIIMKQQDDSEPLGRWINRMFLAIFAASTTFADLSFILAFQIDGNEVDTFNDWFVVIGVNVACVFVTICGIMVAIWNRRLEEAMAESYRVTEQQKATQERQNATQAVLDQRSLAHEIDHRDRADRQDKQQVILDEASLANAETGRVNADRGHHLSEEFAVLEKQRITMADRKVDLDDQERRNHDDS